MEENIRSKYRQNYSINLTNVKKFDTNDPGGINMKFILSFVAATLLTAGTSSAAILTGDYLTGTFEVEIRNYNAGGSRSAVHATEANEALNAIDAVITYTGALDFRAGGGPGTPITIQEWLETGSGSFTGLDATTGARQLSSGRWQETTMFTFSEDFSSAFQVAATHDDGVSFFDDGAEILSYSNATSERETGPGYFDGGEFKLIYVAANGNPSVLEVESVPAPVPLPAAGWMLVAGLGGLGALRRMQTT